MSRFATLALVLIIALAGTLSLASSAEAIPSCVGAGNVTELGASGCGLGELTFSNFVVSPAGVIANVFLSSLSAVVGKSSQLTFQISHEPSPANLADILMYYTVNTLPGHPGGIAGVSLYNPGDNVTIREAVCGTPFTNGVCTSGLLSTYNVTSNSFKNASFESLAAAIYVRKDIQLLTDSFISEFTNGHDYDGLAPTPEPTTLLLLGSSLTAAGMAIRRRARKARPEAAA
jgi:PEP-CTERM motif